MSFATNYATANDATFKQMFQMALCLAAEQIAGEASSTHNKADEKRHTMAVTVLTDGGVAKLQAFLNTAVPVSGLTTSSTDAAVSNSIASIWNAMAGVSAADLVN
jgi:hypothetical protein